MNISTFDDFVVNESSKDEVLKQTINANIQSFQQHFEEEYGFLYDNDDDVPGYDKALDEYDAMIKNKNFIKFVDEFKQYARYDLSTDREVAAFMFALDNIEFFEWKNTC